MELVRICASELVCIIFFAELAKSRNASFASTHRTNVCLLRVIAWGRNKIFTQVRVFHQKHNINFIICRLFMELKKYYMLRLLIFLSFLLFIDVYAFQAIRLLIQHKSLLVRSIVYGFYWFIPLAAATMLIFSDALGTANWPKGWLSVIRAFFFIAYLSKFMVAGILLIDDFRRIVLYVYDRWAPSPQVDTSRSRFLAQLALFVGGLPLVFLSYGMARNPYRYQIMRQRLQLRNLPPSLAGLRRGEVAKL